MFEHIEEQVRASVEWLRLVVEALGALVIAVGVVLVVIGLVRHMLSRQRGSFMPIRLTFARYLTMALELQLAAIAVIRTGLNYFLTKEINEERRNEDLAVRHGGSRPPE